MWNKSRNGSRSLNRSLNRGLYRRLDRHDTQMLNGAPRPPEFGSLNDITRLFGLYLRIAKGMEERDPILCGPSAAAYLRETFKLEKQAREFEQAVRKVYGEPSPGEESAESLVARLWADRYPMLFPESRTSAAPPSDLCPLTPDLCPLTSAL